MLDRSVVPVSLFLTVVIVERGTAILPDQKQNQRVVKVNSTASSTSTSIEYMTILVLGMSQCFHG